MTSAAASPFDQLSKALVHADRLRAIARGELPPPVSVKLELTNVCNHDCHFCAYRKIVQAPLARDALPTERVLALVDELAAGGVHGLMLTGGGEPTVHPGIDDIIARCRARGLAHALITNGALLDRLSDTAIAGMRWIRFSINAGTRQDYARVHGVKPAVWDRVWEQVRRAVGLARANASAGRAGQASRPAVGVSFVVTTWNHRGLEPAVRAARDAGVDYVHIRPAFEGPHTQLDRQLDRGEIADSVAAVTALEALSTARFRVLGVTRRFAEIEAPPRELIHCRATPLVAYVLPTGDVSICTVVRDAAFNPAVPDPFLGNIHRDAFFDIWGTDRHRRIIAGLSASGCTRCHFSEYNRALAVIEDDALHHEFL